MDNIIVNKNNMKKYMIEYRDSGDYGCGEIIEAKSEDHAIRILQNSLLKEGDFMSRLVRVYEAEDQEYGQ